MKKRTTYPIKRSQLPLHATPIRQKKRGWSLKAAYQRLFSGFSLQDSSVWQRVIGGGTGTAEVNATTAMQLSAVWRAVRLTAETVSTLPLRTYVWEGEGPQVIEGSPTDELIRVSPNDEQTGAEFWEGMQSSQELVGDGVAIISRIGNKPVSLRMVNPTAPRCIIERNAAGGIQYRITDDKGREKIYPAKDIFHMKGFAMGGIRGISTVSAGAQSMGLAYTAQQQANRFYKNGLRLSGFLTTQSVFNPDDRKRLQQILEEFMGAENAGGVMALEGGMDFKGVGISPMDAELLVTRKFEIEEIGRWFGVPPILLGHAVDGQTMWGSGVESIIQAWFTLGLRQRLVRNQQAIHKRLMTPAEKAADLYARYNPDALLALNTTSRIAVLSQAIQSGQQTVNEARALQERGPVDGGDRSLVPVNLVPLSQIGENNGGEQNLRSLMAEWLKPELGESKHAPRSTDTA